MPRETLEFRVAFRRLLIGLLFTVLPICLVALYAVAESRKNLQQSIGSHFRTIADSTATEIAQLIHDVVIEVGFMAVDSAVLEAVVASNRSYSGVSDAAITARIQQIEKTWTTPAADPLVKQIAGNRASQVLRRYRELDRRLLRVTVTDQKGATVAATHKTIDYFQADEDYWQNIYAQGRGSVSLTDIQYDEVTKSHYIGVGVPIFEQGSAQVVGTLDALIEVSSIFPIVQRAQLATSVHASLVKDDGTVITGPGGTLAMNLKSQEHAAVLETQGSLQSRQAGYVVALVGNQGTVIGFADTGLKQDYQNLAWTVVVSQRAAEAFAPVRAAERLLLLMVALGLGAVTFVSVYFSLHRRKEAEEFRP